jgi:hypothetical protein
MRFRVRLENSRSIEHSIERGLAVEETSNENEVCRRWTRASRTSARRPVCPACGAAVIAKCGNVKGWHWAHRGRRTCDPWWEHETEWHRTWKNHVPKDWQEIVHRAESGEKHIADVKTERGVVLEFQHSFVRPDEREARESFYPKMVWVVNGLRLKRDRAQFFASLGAGIVVKLKPLTFSFPLNKGALLRIGQPAAYPCSSTSDIVANWVTR